MAIISFDKDMIIDYVPAYGGNRDSDDPCIVRLKFVPYSKVQHYAKLLSARALSTMTGTLPANASSAVFMARLRGLV